MANDSPFYLTRLECPICKTLNEFETVRVGAYVEYFGLYPDGADTIGAACAGKGRHGNL